MAQGRQRETWEHTSSILAMMVNSNPFRESKRAVRPRDFNPFYVKSSDDKPIQVPIAALRCLFVKE